ncbi:unnamed protein product [Leptosia nina]|uniref:Uncharacterized protein n=1 Tax=Leptosia nina TaxID=320188 RepID=A0AAV1JKL5_9NEOP
MGWSFSWTILCLNLLSFLSGAVHCEISGGPISNNYENKELSSGNNVSTRSQLMNTLLTVAAANGVLPQLLPIIQPSLTSETPKDVPKTLNLIQLNQNQPSQEPVVVTGKPIISPSPCTKPQQIMAPAVRVDNPSIYPSSGIVQPIPATWQAQPVYRVPDTWQYQPARKEVIPATLSTPVTLENPSLAENENIDVDGVPATTSPCIQISNDPNESSVPVNLQINVPAQSVSPPQVTVVTAPVSQRSVQEPVMPQSPFPPFFHPPIVVDRSDSLSNLLPIILVALFANDRDCYGGCNCNCCCPCNGGSKNVVPIPYPIPFPINNAIVNSSGRCRSKSQRHQEKSSKEDEDEQDH